MGLRSRLRLALILLATALAIAACSNPDRVRIATGAPWPPVPKAKPGGLPEAASPPATTAAPPRFQPPRFQRVKPAADSYRVQRGDTLFSISQRFDVPLAAVIDANNLEAPFELHVGQQLRLPSVQIHEVQRGQTLYAVARQHDLDPAELAQANRLEAPYSLWVGQRLVLPDGLDETPGREVEVSLAEAAAAIAPAGGSDDVTSEPLPEPGMAEGTSADAEDAGGQRDRESAAQGPGSTSQTAAVPAPPPRSGGRFLWPLQGEMLASYGPLGDGRHNDGVNIAAPRGTEVMAAENGVVAYAGNELRGFGNLLLIKHADNWITAYAHNDELLVGAGDSVSRGQPIARVGNTGSVARPQLHFEIRKGTRAIDPMPLLEAAGG